MPSTAIESPMFLFFKIDLALIKNVLPETFFVIFRIFPVS
jgi:hypothetical protein